MTNKKETPSGGNREGAVNNLMPNDASKSKNQQVTALEKCGAALMALGYDVVPIAPGSKAPKISGWQKLAATPAHIPGWISSHTGCGIRGPRTVGVDIDSYDRDLTQHMLKFTRERLGDSPFRVGMMPKALLPYRCEIPFYKITSAKFKSPDGKEHKLEILADGQQFVASHIHPDTGKPYIWQYSDGTKSNTLTMHRADLPEITEAGARALIEEFELQCMQRGWQRVGNESRSRTESGNGDMFIQQPCPEDQRAIVRDALLSMPADDRDLWQRMGHALKTEGAEGWPHDLFMEWSATSPKHDREQDQKTWESFKPQRTDYRSILAEAQRQGWINPASGSADIERLAALSAFEYERIRESEAKRFKVRVSVLDKAVEERRKEITTQNGSSGMFPAVELWPDPVDGAALLTEIYETINQFIVCEKETATAATLWIAFTWFIDHVKVAPLAVITAPEMRCGKSQLLEIISSLSYRPLMASNISPASIYRVIEAHGPTLLIDEADTFLKDNEEVRGILNSGHTRKLAYVIRTVGEDHEPKQFSTWGAKAISGIGTLANTLMDRAIVLELRRKLSHETVERLLYADPAHFQYLSSMLARYAEDNGKAIGNARPLLLDALNDRAQANWEPLLAIADHAGGDWPQQARGAALKISGKEQESVSISAELLTDIRDIFESRNVDKIHTYDLLSSLCTDDTKPWASWNRGKSMSPAQLAKRLKEYKIQPKNIRIGGEVNKGYERVQFADAFMRYLSPSPCIFSAVTPLQNPENPMPEPFSGVADNGHGVV